MAKPANLNRIYHDLRADSPLEVNGVRIVLLRKSGRAARLMLQSEKVMQVNSIDSKMK